METEKFRKLLTVSSVFVDTKLEVLGELLVEFLVVLLVFLDFSEHFETLLDDVFLHHLKDFVLLKSFTRNVEWEIFRVNNTLNKAEPFRNDVFTVVHDKDTSDVELDVVLLLLAFKKIEGSSFGQKEKGSEFKGTFNIEMLDS